MIGLDAARTARPGDHLGGFERRADFPVWNRYAAVNDEFVPIHMDDDAGRRAGHQTAIGMGNLGISQIHCLLRNWLPAEGRIASMSVRFRSPSVRGRTNEAKATVTSVIDGGVERTVELDVWVEDDTGEVLTAGTATVELPSAESSAGSPADEVSSAEAGSGAADA